MKKILSLAFSILLLTACGKDKDDPKNPDNQQWDACFVASLSNARLDQEIQFENCTQGAAVYRWEFGDGSGSTQVGPVHEYDGPGEYTVSLVGYDTAGTASNPATHLISIELPPWEKAEGQFRVLETCGSSTASYPISLSFFMERASIHNLANLFDEEDYEIMEDGEFKMYSNTGIYDESGDRWEFFGARGRFSSNWDTLRYSYSMKGIDGNSALFRECTCEAIRE